MTITYYPRAGDIFICDLGGFKPPEMDKVRPVIVVSPKLPHRGELVTIVPLSTTAPHTVYPSFARSFAMAASSVRLGMALHSDASHTLVNALAPVRLQRIPALRRVACVGLVAQPLRPCRPSGPRPAHRGARARGAAARAHARRESAARAVDPLPCRVGDHGHQHDLRADRVAVSSSTDAGPMFLGAQGDAWDAHKDMALATGGAVFAVTVGALRERDIRAA